MSPRGPQARTAAKARAWGIPALLALASVSATGCAGHLRSSHTPVFDDEGGWKLVSGVPFHRQREHADCGPAALAMVAAYWRGPEAAARVRDTFRRNDDRGQAAGTLRMAARHAGLRAYLFQGTLADLETEISAGRPVLVGLARVRGNKAFGHYEVVVGLNPARAQVLTADPAGGWRRIDYRTFAKEWERARHLTLVALPPGT